MSLRQDAAHLGRATITPGEPVIAASYGTWTVEYTVGIYGYDERARLKIARRSPCDCGAWQAHDPQGPGFTRVRKISTDDRSVHTRLTLSFEPRGGPRPFYHAAVVTLAAGSLYPGDRIEVVFGDRSQGSPGLRAQTYCETRMEWRTYVDPFGTEVYTALDPSPGLEVIGGSYRRHRVVAPTTVVAGEAFDFVVKAEDGWGNLCRGYDREIRLAARGGALELPAAIRFQPQTPAAVRQSARTTAAIGSVIRIAATAEGQTIESNPIVVVAPTARTWWGDLHGQTGETIGTGSMEEYNAFARDVSLCDMICHQSNDFQVTDAVWRRLLDSTRAFHEDGRFVVFLGYEWSGMTAGGGDRNVLFAGETGELVRSSKAEIPDPNDSHPDAFPLTELYAQFRKRSDVMLIPHIGGRYADIRNFFDPALESLIEIYSDWGRFEWLIADAMEKKYKVGFVANSDGHKGRPGASHPGAGKFGVMGGLTCVQAASRTRQALFDALRARRCYGVSHGERIHIDLTVAGLPMGAEGEYAGPPPVRVRVEGTVPIWKLELFRNLERVASAGSFHAEDFAGDCRVRVAFSGSKVRGRDRLTDWDGEMRLSAGRIVAASGYNFANPDKGIVRQAAQSVAWTGNTTGGESGIDMTLEAPSEARLAFQSPVIDTEIPLSAIPMDGVWQQSAGGLDLTVFAHRLPNRGGSRSMAATWTAPAPVGDYNAYWLRVTQLDGVQAWTSPVYLAPLG